MCVLFTSTVLNRPGQPGHLSPWSEDGTEEKVNDMDACN